MAAAGIQPVGEITHSTLLAYIRQRDDDRAYLATIAQYIAWWIVNGQRPKESWVEIEHITPMQLIDWLKNPVKTKVSRAEKAKQKKQREKWDQEVKAKHLGLIK